MTKKPTFGRSPSGFGFYAILLAATAICGSANAALLLYEGFSGYTAGSAFDTVTPNGNTTGLADSGTGSSYANAAGTNSASTMTVAAGGLSLGSLATSGGALNFSTSTAVGSANITSTTGSSTIWGSFVVSMSTFNSTTASGGFEVRLNSNAGSLSGNAYFRSDADTRGELGTGVSVSYGGTLGAAGGSLTAGTPYLILSKFDTTAGTSTLWALSAPQFDAFVAAGRTEAFLNANATATASATRPATGTFGWNSAGTPSYLEIVTSGAAGVVDEIRYGETIAEVTPVPEPSSALLIGAAAAFGLGRRKRPC